MNLMIYLLQVTVCLAIFYGFYLVLEKQTTFYLNRIYLLSTILISLVIPVIIIKINEAPGIADVPIASYVLLGDYMDDLVITSTDPSHVPLLTWPQGFMIFYISGVLFFLIRLLLDIRSILRLRSSGIWNTNDGIDYVVSEKIQTPFSFFSTIYLPLNHGFNEHELRNVLSHENLHQRDRHSFDLILLEMIKSFIWLSPMIYLYRRKLKEVHEFAADAAVMKDDQWDHYAQFLLRQKSSRLPYCLSNQLVYSQLKKRIIMMTTTPSTQKSLWRYLGIIPVLLFLILMFSFRDANPSFESGVKKIFVAGDSLPTTYITGLRLTSPVDTVAPSSGLKLKYPNYTMGMPVFPGCEEVDFREMGICGAMKMTDFINHNMVYPMSLKEKNIEGRVVVKFIVGTDGLIKNADVVESLHPDADAAALKVINSMNQKAGKWQPAAENGILKDAEMSLPIKFSLGSKMETRSADVGEPIAFPEVFPVFCEDIHSADKNGCSTESVFNFIYKNIKYPDKARENGQEGVVIVKFIIDADGRVTDPKILKGDHADLNEEAIRLLNSMNEPVPHWLPGKDGGKVVPVELTLPFKFVLQTDSPKTEATSQLILTVTADRKYYLNSVEISVIHLDDAIENAIKNVDEPSMELRMAKELTVQDLSEVLSMAERLKVKVVLPSDK